MGDSIKILPAVMVASLMLFLFKAVGFWTGFTEFASQAQAKAEEEQVIPEPVSETNIAEDPVNMAKMALSSAPDANGGASVNVTNGFMSETEIQVLQSLASRREALDVRAQDLDLREKLLKATEIRVDGKIKELKTIEARIEHMLALRSEEEEAQIKSLVKVYESMKAKDAARIFEQLETDILLDVAGRMKEVKVAGIMAAMTPDAAQELTVLLATRRNLPLEDVLGGPLEGNNEG